MPHLMIVLAGDTYGHLLASTEAHAVGKLDTLLPAGVRSLAAR